MKYDTKLDTGSSIMEADILSARLKSFHNVVEFIDIGAELPQQVFTSKYGAYLFFESDTVFSPHFVHAVHKLCNIEQGTSCCFLNITRSHSLEYQEAEAIYIEPSTTDEEYAAKLMEGGPVTGWIFRMERYGCASDTGEWCIYCERENDIALIALRDQAAVMRYRSALQALSAEPIESLTDVRGPTRPPFSMLTTEWNNALVKHYGAKAAHR